VHEGQKALGDGVGYVYPPDTADGVAPQQYLPDGATEAALYRPRESGVEEELARRLDAIDEKLGKPPRR
jgi:putative ATPase